MRSFGERLLALDGLRSKRALVVLATLAAILAVSVGASAAEPAPERLVDFCQSGAGAGQCNNPRGIAADPFSGDVYVSSLGNDRINEFTSWGEFVKAWGWEVNATEPEPKLQTCTVATGCRAASTGPGVGQLTNPNGIAVDSGGDVYVYDRNNFRVQKFSPNGDFLLMFGGEVNKTKVEEREAQEAALEPITVTEAEENLCPFDSGDECKGGVAGTGNGELGAAAGRANIAVGPADTIYLGDEDRIQEFNTEGVFEGELGLPGEGFITNLAVDGSDNLYFVSQARENAAGAPPGGERKATPVSKITSAGTEICRFTVAPVSGGGSNGPKAVGLATDVEGNIYATVEQGGSGGQAFEVQKFDSDCEGPLTSWDPGGAPGPIATSPLASGSSVPGDVFVGLLPGANIVRAYGPLPQFEVPPSVAPEIGSEQAVAVGARTAGLEAEVNPHFFSPTNYSVQYGTASCTSGGCTSQQPASPGLVLNGERAVFYRTARVQLSGLAPTTTYHYRFIATNEAGLGPGVGEERTFTTRPEGGALPDGRAYELATPGGGSAEFGTPIGCGGCTASGFSFGLQWAPIQSASDGSSLTYHSLTSVGEGEGAPGVSQYISRRGSGGWDPQNITPATRESKTSGAKDPFQWLSTDLGEAAVVAQGSAPTLPAGTVEGYYNLYRRDASGALSLLSPPVPPTLAPGILKEAFCIGYAGSSADGSRVFFTSNGALALVPGAQPPVAEVATVNTQQSLYEWSAEAGGLRLVSVLPGGEAAAPASRTGFGAGQRASQSCETKGSILDHAVSSDGVRAVWTASNTLYDRVGHSQTIQLDAAEAGAAGPSGGGRYWAASPNGSKVLFSATGKLTTEAGSSELYLYDFGTPVGERLTALSHSALSPTDVQVQGVVATSEALNDVYFVSKAVLADNKGAAVVGPGSSERQQAVNGQNNLYLWREGQGLRFIARLDEGDGKANWGIEPVTRSAHATPDGAHLAFTSTAPLTGFDNTDQASGEPDAEAFLYDAPSDTLVCASCDPSGARPSGPAALAPWSGIDHQPRSLSPDGERLFFETPSQLSSRDANELSDVYEYERAGKGSCATAGGCIELISSGQSADVSYLIDASTSGDDVFFSTRSRLVGEDTDERYDIYDARVGGGFAPAASALACTGEGCRPVQPGPATAAPAASAGFSGAGNLHPQGSKRCPKGKRKVHRHGRVRKSKAHRHGKARCAARHKKRHPHHKRAAHPDRRTSR